ncbi:hypothetical protein JAAARDRAFT_407870 [Jaapia argillacea MUCL 33604]|uniref:Uncharacterized protein n=1 Tax=Jaapia argillacea MUCL 33604 TaxID=933084 RepID=A0A067PVQ0_9AGAM|nr:hypothetical protein JAAARDRAFT_407870 [Jaapia argillacea MUCL 33604]
MQFLSLSVASQGSLRDCLYANTTVLDYPLPAHTILDLDHSTLSREFASSVSHIDPVSQG